MKKIKINNLLLLEFEGVDNKWPLKHCISTRIGGVSPAPFNFLNLGFNLGDEVSNVVENRQRICNALGASVEKFVAMKQSHTNNVIVVDSESLFGGFGNWENSLKNVDALVTNMKNVTLFAVSADCALTLFFDPIHKVIAISHNGWRGSVLNIYSNVIKVMSFVFGTKPEDLFVGIGPLISSKFYDVSKEIISKLCRIYNKEIAINFFKKNYNKYYLSIHSILLHQLKELGVKQIEFANLCTGENLDIFYSHRVEGHKTGRFGLFAYLI